MTNVYEREGFIRGGKKGEIQYFFLTERIKTLKIFFGYSEYLLKKLPCILFLSENKQKWRSYVFFGGELF